MDAGEKPAFTYRTRMVSNPDYIKWFVDIKQRFRNAQLKAVAKVNTEMLKFYWSIGRDLYHLHLEEKWGEGILEQFALDLRNAFPGEKGFSLTNIKYMRRWYCFYYERISKDTCQPADQLAGEKSQQPADQLAGEKSQQPADQLAGEKSQQSADQLEMPENFGKIPWFHHVQIFSKTGDLDEALFYINQAIIGGWSRSVLECNLKSKLYERLGKASNNFVTQLPRSQAKIAQEILKDPYNFEFLSIQEVYDEKDLEEALVANITRFLLELGQGFAFVGRQMELKMADGQTFFPDLVFYHIKLKCYVVIDLKAVAFMPEFAGKINFYISAADELLRGADDNPTIGLILCKESDRTVVEWTLRGIDRPLGVATYQLQEVVDRTIAEIESRRKE